MKITLLLVMNVLMYFSTVTPINWNDLKDVKFSRRFVKEHDMYFLFPKFGNKVSALNGAEIQIKGYMIPVDPEEKVYVLSAKPMASCFFCGGAGPETIVQLNLKKKRRFSIDEIWTVQGKFRLNKDDLEECNYILDEAEPIKKN